MNAWQSPYEFVGITSGMRGYFAVHYDEDGPIQTGIGSYETPEEAAQEAYEWAASDEIPLDDETKRILALA